DARGGALLSVTYATDGIPVIFVGNGQKYTDLKLFQPEKFVNELVKSKN
ncbi:MAG: hypothetical protein ACW991_05790, partial [Candidatus Hodarchaeales archaeon]